MKKRPSLQQVVWENWTVTWKTIKSEHSLIPYMKINSKAPTVRNHKTPRGKHRQHSDIHRN